MIQANTSHSDYVARRILDLLCSGFWFRDIVEIILGRRVNNDIFRESESEINEGLHK